MTKLKPKDPKDPARLIYSLGHYAKFVGYITGSVFLIDALRILLQLLS